LIQQSTFIMANSRTALFPFALLIQMHCLRGVNSVFTKTRDDLMLGGPSKGSKCTPGHDILKEECVAAATLLGGVLRNNDLLVGNWPNTPPGCFIQKSDKTIHYGENPDSINDSRFQPVCVTPADEATLLQASKGMKCTAGKDFSKDECISAATSVGGALRDGHFKVGEWSHTPYGCFIEGEDKAIHFGTNIGGVNTGHLMQPVCKTALDEARLLPAPWDGSSCKVGHDFPEDDCVDAALSVGGKLRNGSFIIGNFPDSPPGCFLEPTDKGVHYNTNTDGINNGQFQPVCMVGELKMRLVTAAHDTRCKPELEIAEEDCVAAAQSVGGKLRNRKFLVGDWTVTPSGCFLQKGDKAIHFGTNPASINNGQFEPVCIADDEVEAIAMPHFAHGTKCIPGHDIPIADCAIAGTSVGGRIRNKLIVGNWAHTPHGCFLEAKDKAVHFGTNPNGVNAGYFQPICKPGEIEAIKLDAGQGVKCAYERDFSKEECVDAGTAVGGILRGNTFLIGDWSNSPPGCFINPSDNAIHYGTDPNGNNLGVFEPVCKTIAHEAALLPAQYGNRCEEGHDFLKEDCTVAATSVGGRLRGGQVRTGSWPMAPPGCFIESKDNAIHFNMIDGVNIGAFQPVCVYA